MSFTPLRCKIVAVVTLVAAVPLFAPQGRAQEPNISGRYECSHVKMNGKVSPCKSAPLTLKSNGRFELRGWEGSYLVNGRWVELSDSVIKSRAKIEKGYKIVFRYHGKNGWVETVYERRVADLGGTALS